MNSRQLGGSALVAISLVAFSPFIARADSSNKPPAGFTTEYTVLTPRAGPEGITTGPDGNIWFTENAASKIGRITPSGTVTEFTGLTATSGPVSMLPDDFPD